MADTFTCGHCGETFTNAWSDEEAVREGIELWGRTPPSDMVLICDDCFQKFMPWAKEQGLVPK